MTKHLAFELYHGRKSPDEEMSDWGIQGPVFLDFDYLHMAYFCLPNVGEPVEFLTTSGDLIYYEGVFYGDFCVFIYDDEDSKEVADYSGRIQKYDVSKANLPTFEKPKEPQPINRLNKNLEPEKRYKTRELIELLSNVLESGYTTMSKTDLGGLLLDPGALKPKEPQPLNNPDAFLIATLKEQVDRLYKAACFALDEIEGWNEGGGILGDAYEALGKAVDFLPVISIRPFPLNRQHLLWLKRTVTDPEVDAVGFEIIDWLENKIKEDPQ